MNDVDPPKPDEQGRPIRQLSQDSADELDVGEAPEIGGRGLIGTSSASISGSAAHAFTSRCAWTDWPPRMRSVGATIANSQTGRHRR